MKIKYEARRFAAERLALIDTCNAVIEEYQADGLRLTLRQLYYQLVSRDVLPNNVKQYDMLGGLVTDARMAGLIDWDAIEDRTRNVRSVSHWSSPADVVKSAAASFRIDKWEPQPYYVEVWIEKEALAGVFAGVCVELDVPYLSCRGYTSASEMWAAAQRFVCCIEQHKQVKILHFGDHDPSGIDMTRDIQARLLTFLRYHCPDAYLQFSLERVALNMPQIEQYKPPENPAKTTDSRFASYQALYGDSSWELDALNPRTLTALVTRHVKAVRNERLWARAVEVEQQHRAALTRAAERWDDVETLLAQ